MSTNINESATRNKGGVENAVHKKVGSAAEGAHEAVDWAADAANSATDSLSDKGQELRITQEKWLAAARDYVQENPVTSVGIAVASGYLLSRILSAR